MPHDPYKALYIHIPFCVKKCLYCDFVSQACSSADAQMESYVDDLCVQIRRASTQGELANIETLYLGGGTPTHLGNRLLTRLLYMISVSVHLHEDIEFTMEANPESLTSEIIRDSWALGVNRLSLGVQSTDDAILELLGRPHLAADALHAIEIAHERFENVSADIMCGIPGQTDESFEKSLTDVVSAGVTHLSVYPLTIEQGTPFHNMYLSGELPELDEDTQARHMELARKMLESKGFERYEVASYAKPGFECKHNSFYWTGVPYLGFGTSAVTMTQNSERRMRKQDNTIIDDLQPAQMRAEDLMMNMRMVKGVSIESLEAAKTLLPQVFDVFDSLVNIGLVQRVHDRYVPTEQGWLCGNELYGRIFDMAP